MNRAAKFLILGLISIMPLLIVFFLIRNYIEERQLQDQYALNRVKYAEQQERFVAGVNALGPVDIPLTGLTLRQLQGIMKERGRSIQVIEHDAVGVGWLCEDQSDVLCHVTADFYAPSGQQPTPNVPAILAVSKPFQGSVDGIHIGDPVGTLTSMAQHRGYKIEFGHSVGWNKGWTVLWDANNDRIEKLTFFNRDYRLR